MLPKPTITRRPEKTVCLMSGILGYFQRGVFPARTLSGAGREAVRARAVRVKPALSHRAREPSITAIFSPPLGIAISCGSASVAAGFRGDPGGGAQRYGP